MQTYHFLIYQIELQVGVRFAETDQGYGHFLNIVEHFIAGHEYFIRFQMNLYFYAIAK